MEEKNEEELKILFDEIDISKNGFISRDELIICLKKLKLAHDAKTINALFDQLDTDNSNSIDFKEFKQFVNNREDDINRAFDEIDKNNNGFIEMNEISTALECVGMIFTAQQLKSFVSKIDKNNDKKISRKEFRDFVMILPSVNIQAIWDAHLIRFGIDIGEASFPEDIKSKNKSWNFFLSGGIAGMISRTLTAPIDRIKIIYQYGNFSKYLKKSKMSSKSPSMHNLIISIFRNEGIKAFYKGNGTNVIKIGPESAIKFFAYEKLKDKLCFTSSTPQLHEKFLAGAGAGIISQVLIYPFEIVKTTLALSTNKNSITSCITNIYRKNGITGIYRGLTASLYGIIPFAGIDLALFNTIKEFYSKKYPSKRPSNGIIFLSGATSCIAGQVVAFPFQCVRTKLQADVDMKTFNGFADCFAKTFKIDGIRGLYRGIFPNMVKAVPAISTSYIVYENVKSYLMSK